MQVRFCSSSKLPQLTVICREAAFRALCCTESTESFSFPDRVTGVAVTPSGDACVTCSTDRSARLFKVPFAPLEPGEVEREVAAVLEFNGKFGFRGLDHHWRDNVFATAGERVSSLPTSIPCLSFTTNKILAVETAGTGFRWMIQVAKGA